MPGSGPDSLIFVDVDGVLNIGVRDGRGAPLLLNDANVNVATRTEDPKFCKAYRESIAKLSSVAKRYGDLACIGTEECSGVLIDRLVSILRPALGGKQMVVLSSKLRQPKYAGRVLRLQHDISERVGCSFEFDARTEPATETLPVDRLRCIGRFVKKHCGRNRGSQAGPLRILVLDDFFVKPLDGWTINGARMREAEDVEAYLRKCAPAEMDVRVKLVHCYQEWETEDGQGHRVEAGVGLSDDDVREALAFLGGPAAPQPQPPAGARPEGLPPRRRSAGWAAARTRFRPLSTPLPEPAGGTMWVRGTSVDE